MTQKDLTDALQEGDVHRSKVSATLANMAVQRARTAKREAELVAAERASAAELVSAERASAAAREAELLEKIENFKRP